MTGSDPLAAIREQWPRARRQGDNILWTNPHAPFTYLIGRDTLTGAWGWAMRNDLVDPPGQYTSEGEFELPANARPEDISKAIVDFITGEVADMDGDDE